MTGIHELRTTNGKEKIKHDYEEILDIIGFGRVQVKMVLLCGMIMLMVMNELMGIGIITIASQCDFNLSEADKGIMHGVLLYGKISSSYFFGYLSDKYGRRSILAYANLAGISCSLATMFITNYSVFVLFRFLIGFFTGGTVGIALAYVAEFSATAHRPAFMNFVNTSNAVCFIYVPIVAWLILLMDWKLVIFEIFVFRPWRILVFFNVLPGLVASLMVLRYPETPKYLLALGKNREAYDALDWVCQQNRNGTTLRELHVYEVKNLDDQVSVDPNEKKGFLKAVGKMFVETLELFKRPHIVNFIVASITMSGSFIISFGLGSWYPAIQNNVAFNGNHSQSQTVCDIIVHSVRTKATEIECNDRVSTQSLLDILIFGGISLIAYVTMGFSINFKRRKPILMALLSVAGICSIALIWLKNPIAIFIVFSIYIILSDLCVSTIVGYTVDLLPTKLCGQGSCLIMTFTRLSGATLTYIIGLYFSSNCVLVFEIFAAIMLLCAILTYFFNPYHDRKRQEIVP